MKDRNLRTNNLLTNKNNYSGKKYPPNTNERKLYIYKKII